MNYRQLQKSLKPLKSQGLINVKLNACEPVLRAEYERLVNAGAIPTAEYGQHFGSLLCSQMEAEDSTGSTSLVASSQQQSCCDEEVEIDQEISAHQAGIWSDNHELAIATIAAYAIAGFTMLILGIALLAMTVFLSGLKCCQWCRRQLANVSFQLKYFEFPFARSLQPPYSAA